MMFVLLGIAVLIALLVVAVEYTCGEYKDDGYDR